jgi:probable phosphoglycerate mutase
MNYEPSVMNNQATKVILVRHGQTTYNTQKLYQGCCDDSLLTEKGRLQAYQTGIALSKLNVSKVYTSPLQRTQETAKEILNAFAAIADRELEAQIHPDLKEIDLLNWQGLPFKYVREHWAKDYQIWKETPTQFRMKVTEVDNLELLNQKQTITLAKKAERVRFPILDLYEQAEHFWQEILPRHLGETIVLVSHGGAIRALIGTALGIKCDRYHFLQQSNCSISILEFDSLQPRTTRLEAMNLTAHLGEVLPKLKQEKLGMKLLLVPVEALDRENELLARSLGNVAIDFCLNSDSANAQAMAESILNYQNSFPVHLQASRHDFLRMWHQTIQSQSRNSSSLVTGLAIADRHTIQSSLAEILGINNLSSVNLKSGTFNVLHYPLSTNHPILQAINFGEWE